MSYRSRRLDGRSRIMKRAAQLAAHYMTLLTEAGRETTSVSLAMAIMSTAELVAISEDMRTRLLRAEAGVKADDLVRMQRLADASVRSLALPDGGPQPATPSLEQYLAAKNGEDA
jgi:hypothetical protein